GRSTSPSRTNAPLLLAILPLAVLPLVILPRVLDQHGNRAEEARVQRVGNRERLLPQPAEGHLEGMRAAVRRREGVIGGQGGLVVAAGEVDGAGVAGGDVAVGVVGPDGPGPSLALDG